MQGNEHLDEELLVLGLQRQRKAVDNRAEYLEQLADAVKVLRLVDEPQEDVVDLLADKGAQPEELAVDAMQHRLEEVALARILRVEELQQLQHKLLVNHALADRRLKVAALEEAQEELVHQIQVRPARLQGRVVLLRVKVGILARRQCPEQICRYLQRKNHNFLLFNK